MSEHVLGKILPEWLNSNQHRAYPLHESTVGNGIPSSFLVDALFINSPSIDSERLYISSIVRNNTNILIKLSGYVTIASTDSSTTSTVATDFGVITVPFGTKAGTKVPVAITGDNYTLAGSLYIGDTKSMESIPSVIELDEETGLIFPGCVRTIDDTLIGIKVNDVLYTGIVTLVAGRGIEFTTSEGEEDGEIIVTITNTEYPIPEDNLEITSDGELLERAVEAYGEPVRTICGIAPDDDGDIVFSTPGTGGDSEQYVEASSTGIGTVCLTIANDKTDVSCTDHSAQIESLAQSLRNLNERSSEIHEGLNALDNAVSNLALQVSRS